MTILLTVTALEDRSTPSVWLDSLAASGPLTAPEPPAVVPADLAARNVQLVSAAEPPAHLWDRLRTDLGRVPAWAWGELASRCEPVWVVYGEPITSWWGLAPWRGERTADGRAYDDLPGAASEYGAVVRLDGYARETTIPHLARHEVGHRVGGPGGEPTASEVLAEAFASGGMPWAS